MLLLHSTKTAVDGTDYIVEYTILKKLSDYPEKNIFEYGIRCVLFRGEGNVVSMEEIQCITPEYADICRMVEILERNQVFPVHLKETVCDLIEARLGDYLQSYQALAG